MQVVFITLKLCSVIDWSWWFVFSPALVDIGWYIFCVIIAILFVSHERDKKRKEWAKYGAKNSLDCRIKKMQQMRKEQQEELNKKEKEIKGGKVC